MMEKNTEKESKCQLPT